MKISECSQLISERLNPSRLNLSTYISTENMLPNIGGISLATSLPKQSVTRFEANDILLSNIRPYFKKIFFASRGGGCSNDVICIRAKSDVVVPKFLFYALSSNAFFSYYVSKCKGTKMPRGDKQALLDYQIKDYSKEEQRHIVDAIRRDYEIR